MSIKAKPISARLIIAKKITARLIQTFSKICRYFSTFDGSTSYAALTDEIVLSGDFEIEFKFKQTSAQQAINAYQTVISFSTPLSSYFLIGVKESGSNVAKIGTNGYTAGQSSSIFQLDTEYKINVIVNQTTGAINVNIDDVFDHSYTHTNLTDLQNLKLEKIGERHDLSGRQFSGQLSDLKIWSNGDRNTGDLILDLPMSEGIKDVYDEVFYRNRVQAQAEWLLNFVNNSEVLFKKISLQNDFVIKARLTRQNTSSGSSEVALVGKDDSTNQSFIVLKDTTHPGQPNAVTLRPQGGVTDINFLNVLPSSLGSIFDFELSVVSNVCELFINNVSVGFGSASLTGMLDIESFGSSDQRRFFENITAHRFEVWSGNKTTGTKLIDYSFDDNSNIIANAASAVNSNVWTGTVTATGESSGDISSVNVLSTAGASSQVSVPATVAGEDVLIQLTLSDGSLDNIIAGDSSTEFAGWNNIKDERGRETNRYETIMHNDNNEVVFKVSGVANATLTGITAKVVEGYGVLQGTQNTDYSWVLNKQPWWFLDFDGGYSAHQRLWNPDATNPSFSLEAYFDAGIDGTIVSQNVSAVVSDREFQIFTQSGAVLIKLGGTNHLVNSSGSGLFIIDFDGSNYTLFKDGTQVGSVSATIGTAREPTADFRIGARNDGSGGAGYTYNGTIKDVKFWVNGTKSTGDLVLDSALDDNSNIIANAASPVNANVWDGALAVVTGESEILSSDSVRVYSSDGSLSQIRVTSLGARGKDHLVTVTTDGDILNVIAGENTTQMSGWVNVRDEYGQPTNVFKTITNNPNNNNLILKRLGVVDIVLTDISFVEVEGYGVLQGTRNTDYEWKNGTPHAIGYNVETNEVCTTDGTNWIDSDLWSDSEAWSD